MPLRSAHIIGSGPNGLAAAVTLAQQGVRVTVFEARPQLGGACATAELTLPGFRHDVGSSVYPLGFASPFFRSLPLQRHGLRWIEPEVPLAHPREDAPALLLEHSLGATAAQFAQGGDDHDAEAWYRLFASSVRDFSRLVEDFMQPLLRIPSHPVAMAFFGMAAVWPAATLARTVFRHGAARTLFAGCAGHSVLPLSRVISSATAVVLAASAHAGGWPVIAGGGQGLTDALAGWLREAGATLVTGHPVQELAGLPPADAVFFDTSARSLDEIAGDALSPAYRTRLAAFRRGPGIFKIDYALSGPIPWNDPACLRAATVHLGGSLEEIERSEKLAFTGRQPSADNDRPFLILVQPSVCDPSRAPVGQHTAWAYCHVPTGSTVDRAPAIEAQIERFAPGFRDRILARRTWNSEDLQTWNSNLRGGDVSGGAMTLTGMLARPTLRSYRTSNPRLYLCSAATPPGGGVHGMAGFNAARAALVDHGAP